MRKLRTYGYILIAAVFVICALPAIDRFTLTGHFFPVRLVDSLSNAIQIASWNQHELIAADNRRIKLPDVIELPSRSAALKELIRRGVEVGTNARVIGLVNVIHGCGNDPVTEHIARVDIADVLLYLGEGVHQNPTPGADSDRPFQGDAFSAAGWEISEFIDFQHRWRIEYGHK